MLILSQNEKSLNNFDSMGAISYNHSEGSILGFLPYGYHVNLGKYSESRSKEILKEIMCLYEVGRKVYIMPKK